MSAGSNPKNLRDGFFWFKISGKNPRYNEHGAEKMNDADFLVQEKIRQQSAEKG